LDKFFWYKRNGAWDLELGMSGVYGSGSLKTVQRNLMRPEVSKATKIPVVVF
jgi:hypothetical protein